MKKKELVKWLLDELIATVRHYHENYVDNKAWYGPVLRKRTDMAKMLADDKWLYLANVIEGSYGMNREITNEDIYKVREVLGWQVTDDGEEA